MNVTIEEAQELVKQYAGKGQIQRDSNNKWNHKEIVNVDKNIGVYVNGMTGEELPTSRFTIHYATKGVHIVPARPEGGNYIGNN